jgi:hypothetical protein
MSGWVFWLAPVLVGIAIGYARGGRLQRVEPLPWVAIVCLLLAAMIQAVAYRQVAPALLPPLTSVLSLTMAALVLGIVGLAVTMFGRQSRRSAIAIGCIIFGAVLNAAVIALNGAMPSSVEAAESAAVSSEMEAAAEASGKYLPDDSPAKLSVLGDVIPVPPLHVAVSIGDLFIVGGLVAFVIVEMGEKPRRRPVVDGQAR